VSAGNVDIAYSGFGVTNWNGTPFPPEHQFAFSSPPRVNHDWHIVDVRADVPLFERDPESEALLALHHPFTAPHGDDIALLADLYRERP
jgi:hypothetical protein